MPKISELPTATLPLTGGETLPLLKGGRYVKAGIGVAQVLEVFGELPTDGPVGRVAYIADAAGGAVPAFFTGTEWRQFGGGQNKRVKPVSDGLFVVGVGPSTGAAHTNGFDRGIYFFSLDGFNWTPTENPYLLGGITNTAYANGVFLFSGYNDYTQIKVAWITTTEDPRSSGGMGASWEAEPPRGYNVSNVGSEPMDATAYNEITGEFTVPIDFVGNITILNPLPRAITPDATWPHIGQHTVADIGNDIVAGVGTQGPVDIRIDTMILDSQPTDFLQAKKTGTSDWQSVGGLLAPDATASGISLRGLLWGPIKVMAVKFQP